MLRLRLSPALAFAALLFATACSDRGRLPTAPAEGARNPSYVLSSLSGKVVINEVLADPSAVADASGEWFEVHNRADTSINLQGWTIASNSDAAHTIASSISVPSRGYVVLGKNGDSGTNGGVIVHYTYGSLNLANSSDWLALRDAAGASVDSVAWSTTLAAGASKGVTEPDTDNLAVTGSNWHTSVTTYGSGDEGTPGAQNDGRRSALTVRVLAVGQGDAVYITNGLSKVVIDGGPSTTAISSFLTEFGLDHGRIDLMILTHGHLDHLSGLREFLKTSHDIDVPIFLETKNTNTGVTITELRDSLNARAGRGELDYRDADDPCGTGGSICTFVLDGGTKLHVLKPKTSDSNENNRSVAVKLIGPDSASFTMWMAGDAEHEAIDWFDNTAGYDTSLGMNVDVLKAGHHGSCNGISSRLLDLLTPSYVTMGVANSNGYGHVHTQTKTLLSGRSIPWYRTDQNGRITISTPGTVGGGYTVSVTSGTASMNGTSDAASSDTDCNNL